MPRTPTTQQYADYLVGLVRHDLRSFDPDTLEQITSWTDLHDYFDANEYLIWADDKFGLDDDFLARVSLVNDAIAIAEKALFPKEVA